MKLYSLSLLMVFLVLFSNDFFWKTLENKVVMRLRGSKGIRQSYNQPEIQKDLRQRVLLHNLVS